MERDSNGIVVAVSFTVTVFDGVDNFVCDSYTGLPAPTENFIAFDNLNESTVINWIKNLVQKSCENQADVELEAYKKRKVITNGLPWAL